MQSNEATDDSVLLRHPLRAQHDIVQRVHKNIRSRKAPVRAIETALLAVLNVRRPPKTQAKQKKNEE